jgi:hypothetical protein
MHPNAVYNPTRRMSRLIFPNATHMHNTLNNTVNGSGHCLALPLQIMSASAEYT